MDTDTLSLTNLNDTIKALFKYNQEFAAPLTRYSFILTQLMVIM